MNLLLDPRFISEEYQPSCRTNIAASALPGGQFYQACIRCILPPPSPLLYSANLAVDLSLSRFHTTTNFTAEEVHTLGKREVKHLSPSQVSSFPAFSAHHHLLNLRSPILRRRWEQSLRSCNSISLWKSFSQNSETTQQTILGGLSA